MKNIIVSLALVFIFDSIAINPKIDWQQVKRTTPNPMELFMIQLTAGKIIGTMNEASAESDAIIIAANWYSVHFASWFDKPFFNKARGYSYDDSFDGIYRAGRSSDACDIQIFSNSDRQLYKKFSNQNMIDQVDFSPAGYIVAATSFYAGNIKVWDIKTGECLKIVPLDNMPTDKFEKLTWKELLGDDIIVSLAEKMCPDINSLQRFHQQKTGIPLFITINNSSNEYLTK